MSYNVGEGSLGVQDPAPSCGSAGVLVGVSAPGRRCSQECRTQSLPDFMLGLAGAGRLGDPELQSHKIPANSISLPSWTRGF